MNVLISGGTGFIGSRLCKALVDEGVNVWVLSRHPDKIGPPLVGIDQLSELKNTPIDIVINLAGEPIADKRWTIKQKNRISSSRISITESLVEFCRGACHKPKLFINGSAIGFYGIEPSNEPINESGLGDESFASQLCQKWESAALKAKELDIRVCLLRIGIVLGCDGGALKKMLPPFKIGFGGQLGHGMQWMSWIHIDDMIGIIMHCIQNQELEGPVNSTAPEPVTNRDFTRNLGKALHRPTFIPMPALIAKILFGQMGHELLLSGKKVLPVKVLQSGYSFKYAKLSDALDSVLHQ